AEFVDLMGNKLVHPSAGLWTIYHAIDSDTGNPFQNYQAIRYVENEIPHIPVVAKGIRNDGYATVSTSNWMPYAWSINNVAFAEVYHTALSYWQSGRNDQAYKLMKSAILDGMYLGNSPGNVGQISHYDAARGECYRDFGDPVGMASRAIIQGLYGILPDAMNDRIVIRPGFPTRWLSTSISTPDIDFAFSRKNKTDEYRINLRFPKPLALTLNLRAPFCQVAKVLVNGKQATWKADTSAVGAPIIQVDCAKANRYLVQIEWNGNVVTPQPKEESIALGETFTFENKNIQSFYDPQEVLKGLHKAGTGWQGIIGGTTGHRTLFAKIKEGELSWWMPVDLWVKQPVEIIVSNPDSTTLAVKLKNNTGKKYFGTLTVNPGSTNYNTAVQILPGATSDVISIPLENTIKGSNKLTVSNGFNTACESSVQCWNISNLPKSQMETVDLSTVLNDSVTHIFKNEYLSPRAPYTTLQIPKQGIGEWTHPNATAHIDDSGLRKLAVNNIFTTPEGLSFASPSAKGTKNIAFTSLWDNYPKQLSVPLTGKASHIYLLMAGSTNYMQSRLSNGEVKVYYTDGSFEKLDLVNPETWCPIEQDYFTDGKAFYLNAPRPYRVLLKSGKVSRNPGEELGLKNITREIDGGAALILDLPLDNSKTLQRLEWKTVAYEVIIGMMG
ncbi:MAG: glycogen debranching protein, partial [Bacteroidota bacterium]|nr:glycogen debranching protein [Bacteroidota bacterium]